ncbi:hypothetical protein KCP71_11250 [Salmonella enterica subsp. enterica]|nr:hypothetical protein KCP71_11250 [Salmonella enterica subsp. enterica]
MWHSGSSGAGGNAEIPTETVGIHMHIGSGARRLAAIWSRFAARWYAVLECGQMWRRFPAGGGLSIPYREEKREPADTRHYYGSGTRRLSNRPPSGTCGQT